MSPHTTGHFTYADWQEERLGPEGELPGLARARVTNTYTGGIESAATVCAYTILYTPDGAGSFTGLQLLTGRLDGRGGSFVVEESGTFGTDGTVRCRFEVVPGTGTAALTGLRGAGSYTVGKGAGSVPWSFAYALE